MRAIKLSGLILKRITSFCCGLLFIVAQAQVLAQELKIGFVDIPYVIDQAPTAKAATARLEQEFKPRQQAIENDRAELKEKKEKLEKDDLVLTKAQRVELDQDIRRIERSLKRDEQEFREDLNIQKNKEFKQVRASVIKAINKLAKDEQFDLILSDGVLYTSKRMDLTDKVLQYLENEQKNGSKPSQ